MGEDDSEEWAERQLVSPLWVNFPAGCKGTP